MLWCMTCATVSFPKPSFRALWRVGSAVEIFLWKNAGEWTGRVEMWSVLETLRTRWAVLFWTFCSLFRRYWGRPKRRVAIITTWKNKGRDKSLCDICGQKMTDETNVTTNKSSKNILWIWTIWVSYECEQSEYSLFLWKFSSNWPCRAELWMQKLRSHLLRMQSLKVLSLKPGVGQYLTIHAKLTARDFFLISTLPVHSPAFFPKPPNFLLTLVPV